MLDRCPHRAAALSEGRMTASGDLQCAYHGMGLTALILRHHDHLQAKDLQAARCWISLMKCPPHITQHMCTEIMQ